MSYLDIGEAEAVHKQEALRKISAMIKRYNITAADLSAILPDLNNVTTRKSLPEAKLFDPFFDVR